MYNDETRQWIVRATEKERQWAQPKTNVSEIFRGGSRISGWNGGSDM